MSESSQPAVQVESVSKHYRRYQQRPGSIKRVISGRERARYEEFWALDDVTIDVPRGSTFGLIGHNGSGKSTLLRLMAGIQRPTKGTVHVNGRVSALLELGAGFHPELSGRENVYLNGAILGLSKRNIDSVVENIIEFSGLGDFIDTPVKVYSSGMYVRLGFAVAVNVDPEILIIDEVIAVGDESFQRRCFDHLYHLRQNGATIIIVTHATGLVEQMCDQAAWLDHGKLMFTGSAPEAVNRYLSHVYEGESERESTRSAQARPKRERMGSGEVEIVGLEFLRSDGSELRTARTGEPVVIRVHFHADQPVADVSVNLDINHESGAYVSGPSSGHARVDLGNMTGDGFVDYTIPRLPLMPGSYKLNVSIKDAKMMHVFDIALDYAHLVVRPGDIAEAGGMVDLFGQWNPAAPKI